MGSDIARLLDSVWTYFVLLFGSIIAVVYASGHAAGTAYPSESWMRYGWAVGFGLMAGAAFVAAFTWNWVRLLEVAIVSLLFAGAYRDAHAWTPMHPTLVWLILAGTATAFLIGAQLDKGMVKMSPADRMVWPWLASVVLGIFACVYFWSWTMLIAVVLIVVLQAIIGANIPEKAAYSGRHAPSMP